ncbi:HesB/IscA family protein [Geminisphaera colitermitum]|uniref:HesB/IscA family protein n=1 Tax=Geminisphaera colitermitum TaxID=1148786 RepID=UPI000301337B|nr:iron-sulfur cluster assembly accessory protein [Geminisphaera colitermitum]
MTEPSTTVAVPPATPAVIAVAVDSASLPEGVREGNEHLVRLTESAGVKVAALIAREKQGAYLRVAISGGGCNGLSYKLRFTGEPRKGDILVRTAGVPVIVDAKTALYLKGTLIDYSNKMIGGGFKFTNPNAKASCSCGESFSV